MDVSLATRERGKKSGINCSLLFLLSIQYPVFIQYKSTAYSLNWRERIASKEWVKCTRVTLIYEPLPEMQFQIPRTVTHLWPRDLFYLVNLRKYFTNLKKKKLLFRKQKPVHFSLFILYSCDLGERCPGVKTCNNVKNENSVWAGGKILLYHSAKNPSTNSHPRVHAL